MSGLNVLVICVDEMRRDALGCMGHPIVKTPHLDYLASKGTRFTRAYSPSPICVPARAAMAAGQHVFKTRAWCNALAYHGEPDSWHLRLREAGHDVVSIGKLHFRSSSDDNGFTQEILPLHIHGGVGWIRGLLRKDPPRFEDAPKFAQQIGPGDDPYTDYDREIAKACVGWLQDRAVSPKDKPWALFASFVRPHYPLTCPREHVAHYPPERVDPPLPLTAPLHPVVQGVRDFMDYDDYFEDDRHRRAARGSYYGLCSFVDDLIGQLLMTLERTGLDKDTLVIFTSDHGDSIGDRGLWTKCHMYEDSSGVPLILRGPGVKEGAVNHSGASLIDLAPTILEAAGLTPDQTLDGESLFMLLDKPDPERAILSEYHDCGAVTAMVMLRQGPWKWIEYPGYAPQLFNMKEDPLEQRDLGQSPEHEEARQMMAAALRQICDPEEINDEAFADQARRIEELGGREGILATPDFDHTPMTVELGS